MTDAKIMEVIARLPDCAGQAAAEVTVLHARKMENVSKILKIPKVSVVKANKSTTKRVDGILP